ncbi:hypothetical protein IJS77_04725 [bacterium]|nr:hypothetical protein [bacterium]
MKKCVYLTALIFLCVGAAIAAPKNAFEIDASKNAVLHNNYGVNYLNQKDYYSAIKEFEIAILINPDTQASSTYYNNLGKAYLDIGYPNLAEKAFKDALKYNSANFEFYQNLVTSYKKQKKMPSELQKAISDTKPQSKIIGGLILIESGKLEPGINMLDEFCFDEPEMILTKGIKAYLQTIVPDNIRF